MPFQKGNTYGGKRLKAGRPSKIKQEIKKAAAEIAREYIETNMEPVLSNYLKLAKGYYDTRYTESGFEYEVFISDGPTTRHFIDKLLPDEQTDQTRPIQIQFVQYNNSVQLHAEGLPVTVLAGNGNGHQASVSGVASEKREGQDMLEFHDFEDVSTE